MSSKSVIASYLATYHSGLLGRSLTPHERMLVEDVLLDFMLDEPSLASGSPTVGVRQALDAMLTLYASENAPAAARIAEQVMALVDELSGRLTRQEHANDVMREHLTMLSTGRG